VIASLIQMAKLNETEPFAYSSRCDRGFCTWSRSSTGLPEECCPGAAVEHAQAGFCVEALSEAVVRFGKPGIFNTDKGGLWCLTSAGTG
jgi:hypothetical protein